MIIGFLRSPRWKVPIMSFLDEHCICFDNDDENKFEFTKIHNVSKFSLTPQRFLLIFLFLKGIQKSCGRLAARVNDGAWRYR